MTEVRAIHAQEANQRQIFRKIFPAIDFAGVLLDGGIGRPSAVNAPPQGLQVRSLLEQPTCTVRLAAKDVRFSSGKSRVQIPHGAPINFHTCRLDGRAPDLRFSLIMKPRSSLLRSPFKDIGRAPEVSVTLSR
jgi:hypothetical protein